MMMTLGAKELARCPVDRRHSISEIAVGATPCFVAKLVSFQLVRYAVEPRLIALWPCS